jgi:hypothetical protein
MYQWMNWITSPKVNAQVAEYFGEASFAGPLASKKARLQTRISAPLIT